MQGPQALRAPNPTNSFTAASNLLRAEPGYERYLQTPSNANTTVNRMLAGGNLTPEDHTIVRQMVAVADDDDHMIVDESVLLSPPLSLNHLPLPALPPPPPRRVLPLWQCLGL